MNHSRFTIARLSMKSTSRLIFSLVALTLHAFTAGVRGQTTPVVSTLYSFTGTGTDGADPAAGLVQGKEGNFYGTTSSGGSSNAGTVFKMTPAGVVTTLYSFSGGSDGKDPVGSLVQGSDGNFYGTTLGAGSGNDGTIFQITPAGVLTTLYSFDIYSNGGGANPHAGLVVGSDGNFYGTAFNGGLYDVGTVYQITPAGCTARPTKAAAAAMARSSRSRPPFPTKPCTASRGTAARTDVRRIPP
jgi:uncharacterized repeat protein (TIGR03803 family)